MITYTKIGMISVDNRWSFLYTDGINYHTMVKTTPFRDEKMTISKGLLHLYDVYYF
jgi:hypothetical protein